MEERDSYKTRCECLLMLFRRVELSKVGYILTKTRQKLYIFAIWERISNSVHRSIAPIQTPPSWVAFTYSNLWWLMFDSIEDASLEAPRMRTEQSLSGLVTLRWRCGLRRTTMLLQRSICSVLDAFKLVFHRFGSLFTPTEIHLRSLSFYPMIYTIASSPANIDQKFLPR